MVHQHKFFLVLEDPYYCVLSVMGAWLEIHICLQPDDDNTFFFGFQGSTMSTIKGHYSDAVRSIVLSETFHPRNDCCVLGTHSYQKYSVTEAQSSTCSKDEADHQGLWE